MVTDGRERTPGPAIDGAMADLAAGRWNGFRARDADIGAWVRVAAKEHDRYLFDVFPDAGGGREEWRSGSWVRRALERGAWLLVPPEEADLARPDDRAAAAPVPAADDGGTTIRRPIRGGWVEVRLPPDVTGAEALAAIGEFDRIAAYLRALA